MTAAGGRTVAGMFAAAARDYPGRTFLRWCRGQERIRWSYAEAAQRVDRLAARLAELGVAPGDRVVVHTAAMVPSILFDLACASAGITFVPLETPSPRAVLDLCARVDARALLTTPDRSETFAGAGPPVVAADGGEPVPAGSPEQAIANLLERAAGITPETTYMLQPTSGTTGGSKLVIRHHAPFDRIARLLGFGLPRDADPPERVLMVAALTHGMGQYLLSIALSLAAELAVTSRIDVDASLDEIRELDPTYIGLTPRVLRSLVAQHGGPIEGRLFGPSARHLMTGGAAPDKDLLAAVERTGVRVVEAYGASEISVVAMSQPGAWRKDVLGQVVDDVRLRVTAEGELEAWTPVMMRGYYGAPELTAAAFTADGYYRTGDRVELGADGSFRYIGRLVDSFNLFDGSHVPPGPIEEAIGRLPWVDQVVLIGDQRPFIAGFVVPEEALRRGGLGPELAERAAREVARACAGFEPNARVRRLALLDRPLPETVHQVVGHGKVRRARAAAIELYADVVAALYAPSGAAAPPPGAVIVEIPDPDA